MIMYASFTRSYVASTSARIQAQRKLPLQKADLGRSSRDAIDWRSTGFIFIKGDLQGSEVALLVNAEKFVRRVACRLVTGFGLEMSSQQVYSSIF